MLSYSGSQAIAALTERTHDAHLFAQARTFRIIQFSGFTGSTGSIDLTARASAILPTCPKIFMTFRELKPRLSFTAWVLIASALLSSSAPR